MTTTTMLLESSTTTLWYTAMWYAAASTAALVVSHVVCVGIIMYYDLSGQWDDYRLHKSNASSNSSSSKSKSNNNNNNNRNVSLNDYTKGMKNFAKDLVLLFFPFMTACYAMRLPEIEGMCRVLYCTMLYCVGARRRRNDGRRLSSWSLDLNEYGTERKARCCVVTHHWILAYISKANNNITSF